MDTIQYLPGTSTLHRRSGMPLHFRALTGQSMQILTVNEESVFSCHVFLVHFRAESLAASCAGFLGDCMILELTPLPFAPVPRTVNEIQERLADDLPCLYRLADQNSTVPRLSPETVLRTTASIPWTVSLRGSQSCTRLSTSFDTSPWT